jgi:hypothetical protein
MKPRILFPLAVFCLCLPAAADVTVASPDGRVQFLLSAEAQGHLEYTVTFQSKNIIDRSPIVQAAPKMIARPDAPYR